MYDPEKNQSQLLGQSIVQYKQVNCSIIFALIDQIMQQIARQ